MKRTRTPAWLSSLGHRERRQLRAMGTFIAALHLLGWGTLIAIVLPQHLRGRHHCVWASGLA